MSNRLQRVNAFIKLGQYFNDYCDYSNKSMDLVGNKSLNFDDFHQNLGSAIHNNGWFTIENIKFNLKEWANALTEDNLNDWLKKYNKEPNTSKRVAIIMAGNIPLVGFHDFMTTLLLGHTALIKLSSNDKILLPIVAECLIKFEPSLKEKIVFTSEKLENYDAIIATGSTNTARYFEHYFGHKPNIIRKSRNSVAVLTGSETTEQLQALGEDIFRYFGLGCRSVSKLFVPKGYNFDSFFKAMFPQQDIINLAKYANNYDYNKAVYLMSEFKLLDNGFLLLKEDESHASPIATLFYEQYNSLDEIKHRLEQDADKLQCIVSDGLLSNEVNFGQTQCPSLSDYADGVDTVDFLLKI